MKTGFVYLAGAGPGDPGLITVKALEAIAEADCVIYDFLANPDLVRREGLEAIYVGKQGGDHTLPQEEINALMVKKAKEGKTVVRLKGGDPFIFGRGGEEAEELVKHGIPFAVIPGVSSFYSAPAYAGIPVTHRDFADHFEVVTGHRRADAVQDGPVPRRTGRPGAAGGDDEITLPSWDPHKTYVFLMGMKNLAFISRGLITAKGFPADTPACVIGWGTTPRQKSAAGTLDSIARIAEESSIKAPAIIIIGGVASLRDRLRWFDALPLFGKKIVVTRTREQASKLTKKLARLGADVLEFPTIRIRPAADTRAIDSAIASLDGFAWVVFTSQNAVSIFFERLSHLKLDARAFRSCRVAAIGPATAEALEARSIRPDLVPGEYIAEALLSEMEKTGVKGARILLPCAAEARDTLAEGLAELGADVARIHLYDTAVPDDLPVELRDAVKDADIITFASSSTARNFFSIIGDTKATLACIGPVTADAVRELGREPEIVAKEYTIDGLVEAVEEYCRK